MYFSMIYVQSDYNTPKYCFIHKNRYGMRNPLTIVINSVEKAPKKIQDKNPYGRVSIAIN